MLDETRGDTQKVDGATDSRHTKISKLPGLNTSAGKWFFSKFLFINTAQFKSFIP